MKTALITLLLALLAADGIARTPARDTAPGASCIRLDRVVTREPRSDTVIDFTLTGGRRYRSTLPAPCPHLTEIDRTYALRFESFAGERVCAGDRFRVVDLRVAGPAAAQPFALCRFGRFEALPTP